MLYQSGQSGNPDDLPKVVAKVRALARERTEAAIKLLVDMMERGKGDQTRLAAANSLLDRGWGKPTQPIAGDAQMPAVQIDDAKAALLQTIAGCH